MQSCFALFRRSRLSTIAVIFLSLFCSSSQAQRNSSQILDDVYELDREVRKGDKDAFLRLCERANDTQQVIDFLGYHRIETNVGNVARRLIGENSSFEPDEVNLSDKSHRANLNQRILAFGDKLHFDPTISAFLVTPLENRETRVELLKVSDDKMRQLKQVRDSMVHSDWTRYTAFSSLLESHNPQAMLFIAHQMLNNRNRYNEYDFHPEKYTDLVAALTGVSVGVPSEKDPMTLIHNFDDEYSNATRLSYAIYWRKHYSDYRWNPSTELFENSAQQPGNFAPERILYQKMESKNADEAIAAFVKLTEYPQETIVKLNQEFDNSRHKNYSLPTFHDKFLEQMTELTRYCRQERIDYKGTAALQSTLKLLRNTRSDSNRFALERSLISTLTLDDITAVEYWGLVYENSWGSTYSTGHILDVFYSEKWPDICRNKKHLALYLKKAFLYKRLGIIGANNNYLCKFTSYNAGTADALRKIIAATPDKDIRNSAQKVLDGSYWKEVEKEKQWEMTRIAEYRRNDAAGWPSDMRIQPTINNLRDSMEAIATSNLPSDKKEHQIVLLSQLATYEQIDIALQYLRSIKEDNYWQVNSLLQDQFGITVDDIRSNYDLDEFLQTYRRLSESELYRYYLQKAGFRIWKQDRSLDYDTIYYTLKYGLVLPFVGGGNIERSTGIYAMVKMLEIEFQTRLDLPLKSQHTNGNTVAKYDDDRRKKWMQYLLDHKLVTTVDQRPPSFVDFDF